MTGHPGRRSVLRLAVLGAGVSLGLVLGAGSGVEAARPKRQARKVDSSEALRRAQKEIAAKRELERKLGPVIREREQTERRVLGELDRIDQALSARRSELKAIESEVAEAEAKIMGMRRQQRLTAGQQIQSTRRLRGFLRTWYESEAEAAPADAAFWCAKSEAARLSDARLSGAELQERSIRAAEHLTSLTRLKRLAASKAREVTVAKLRKSRFLEELRLKKGQEQSLLSENVEARHGLEREVDKLEREVRRADPGFGVPATARVGQLLWPVRGPILRRFGVQPHSEFNANVYSSGVEIGSPAGVEVRVVEAGRVERSKWLQGFGRVMIVNHGSHFYTLYGHLQDAAAVEGQTVKRGAVIGTVGDTGSLGEPSLYFEIRQKSQARDPLKYLGRESAG